MSLFSFKETHMLWIIYSKDVLSDGRPNALSWMLEEAKNLNIECDIMFAEDFQIILDNGYTLLYKNMPVALPEAAFIRCYHLNLCAFLEQLGVKTYNHSRGLLNSRNKWTTHLALIKENIKTPKSTLCYDYSDYNHLKEHLGSPFILKDSFGTHGDQVFLIHNLEDYERHLKKCSQGIAQVYIESSYGKDLRVHVINDKVVACVLRQSDHSFLSNFAQGGQARAFVIDEEAKQMAINATKALDLNFSGVDLLFDKEGYIVCEVNGIPGFRTLGLTTKENLPYLMLDYIKEQL